ncbi:MAG: glycosyltransferase family 39 protein [Coriobacteriia bacterium]|nr:glycosyltransferase family 39 protein [Coriobacteriia bacterium]
MDRSSPSERQPNMMGLLAAGLVIVVGGTLVVFKVLNAIHVGPGWDTYAFLANAAEFAGKGFGYTELHRPPFLSWLTSLVFRTGVPLHESAIQWVDGALSLSGLLAFYLLTRKRLEPVFATAGALALLAVTPLWAYLGLGYTDTASIALSLWTLLALVAATERSPWWYLLAGPLFVTAVLTRFTALLVAFPAVVWVVLRWQPFRQARRIIAAVVLAVGTYLPAAFFYQKRFGDSLFPFIIAFGFSEEITSPAGEGGASGQALFYLRNIVQLLGPERLVLITVFLLLIGAVGLIRGVGGYVEHERLPARRWLFAALGVLPAIGAQLAGGLFLRQITIPIALIAVYRSLAPRDASTDSDTSERTTALAALDATMLAWLLAYLDFHGHQTIQVPRYFITMAPGFIYFAMRGWSIVARELGYVFGTIRSAHGPIRRGLSDFIVPVTVIGIVAILVGGTLFATPREVDRYVAAARTSAEWLDQQDSSLDESVIYSDVWPLTSWYLKTEVRAMPSFEEVAAFGHELDKNEADYFFTLRARRFPDFRETLDSGTVVLLERTAPSAREKPEIQYLGKSWDNYVESLAGYGFYLMSTAGRYGWEGSAFLDAYSAEELSEKDAVAVYGVRWRSRADGEKALQEYVEAGGSVIFDAARNLHGLAYRVADTIVFDTVVRQGQAPPEPKEVPIRASEEFVATHPELGSLGSAAPFVDEMGGPWKGAVYEARPGTPDLETLVWLGDKPLIQVREMGEGRVYFVAYNLVWHAFYAEDGDEALVVRALFDDAVERGTESGSR